MTEKSEGLLKKRIREITFHADLYDRESRESYFDKILDEAKAEAPIPNKIIEIAKWRLGSIPEGGLGKAILDCIESAEWRDWFEKYFGEAV